MENLRYFKIFICLMDRRNFDISCFTNSKLLSRTIQSLAYQDNFNKLNEDEKKNLINIKKIINRNFILNLVIVSSAYSLLKITLLRNVKKFNRLNELIIITFFSYYGGFLTSYKNVVNSRITLDPLEAKYTYLIKNSILLDDQKKIKKRFEFFDIHKNFDYFQLNFFFLLLFRIFF